MPKQNATCSLKNLPHLGRGVCRQQTLRNEINFPSITQEPLVTKKPAREKTKIIAEKTAN